MERKPWKVICLTDVLNFKAGRPVLHCSTEAEAKAHVERLKEVYLGVEWDVVYRNLDRLKTYDAIQEQKMRAILEMSRIRTHGDQGS